MLVENIKIDLNKLAVLCENSNISWIVNMITNTCLHQKKSWDVVRIIGPPFDLGNVGSEEYIFIGMVKIDVVWWNI